MEVVWICLFIAPTAERKWRNKMVRFTERDEHGDLYVKEHDYISASKKLAEYEDTGLTPEQIIQMERENIKLNNNIFLS